MDRLIKIRKDKQILGTITWEAINDWDSYNRLDLHTELPFAMAQVLGLTETEINMVITKLLGYRNNRQPYPDEIQI